MNQAMRNTTRKILKMPSTARQYERRNIESVDELMMHALQLERDAALRYLALAEQMEVHNNTELAAIFRKMAALEQMHVRELYGLCDVLETPPEYRASRWLGLESGEAPDFADVHYQSQPRHMLQLAMAMENRNADYFAELAATTKNPLVREFATRLMKEEELHIAELEKWIVRYPEPEAGWDEDLDPPGELE